MGGSTPLLSFFTLLHSLSLSSLLHQPPPQKTHQSPLNLPPLGGDGLVAGPLLTKTLLIYALSAGSSNNGPRLVAYDKATGRELASVDIPGIALGTPMTYRIGDKQYIALTVSGRNGELPEIIALTLP